MMRKAAFVLSATAAVFSAYGFLSGDITVNDLEWHQAVIVGALWLGWVIPAIVLLIEECRQ